MKKGSRIERERERERRSPATLTTTTPSRRRRGGGDWGREEGGEEERKGERRGILGKMGIFSEYGVVRHQIFPNMPLTVPIFSFAYAF